MKPGTGLAWIADRPLGIVPLAIVGITLRIVWTLLGNIEIRDTELRNAAVSWAQTGAIADAFRVGSGPTAHVGALPPIIPGLIFRMLGPDTAATSIVLTVIAALTVIATAFVLNRLFARLGTGSVLRGAAMLVICVLPLHLELEARSLRVYENGFAALGLAILALAVVRLHQRGSATTIDMAGLSALCALLMAVSPIAGATGVAMLGIFALDRLDWPRRMLAGSILAVALVGTTLPWALRNQALLGVPIWSRDNFGLEFAIGTHAAAVAPAEPARVYIDRLAAIHPHQSDPAYRAMQAAGGEVAYAARLGQESWGWVAQNPADAATIWLRHLREFYFPPPWLWAHTATPDATMPFRMVIVDVIGAFALLGLAAALWQRRPGFGYLVPVLVLTPLPYLLTQPLIRYRYLIASLLVFLAADSLGRFQARRSGQAA